MSIDTRILINKKLNYYSVINVQLTAKAANGEYRVRTDDPLLAKQVLSQLS